MAVHTNNFWSNFWGLPRENESYLFYFATLKFIWAPIVAVIYFLKDWLFSFFSSNPRIPEDHEIPEFTGQAPLYEHQSLTRPVPPLKKIADPGQMVEEFEQDIDHSNGGEIGNTPLTAFLANSVYGRNDIYKQSQAENISVLKGLCVLAQTSLGARRLLTTPNMPSVRLDAGYIASGFPVNTPLMLLVKAGDLEAVKLVLPFYSADDFMITTPRKNSVFHIATITGQDLILNELTKRARELGIEAVYKEHKNSAGYTAYQMLVALCATKEYFKDILTFSDPYLGGEEINKAAIADIGFVHVARRGAVTFRKQIDKNVQAQPTEEIRVGMTPF